MRTSSGTPWSIIQECQPKPGQDTIIACLWSESPDGDEQILSFAAITDDSAPEVAAAGHDRTIIQIKPENVDRWLTPEERYFEELHAILNDRPWAYLRTSDVRSCLEPILVRGETKNLARPGAFLYFLGCGSCAGCLFVSGCAGSSTNYRKDRLLRGQCTLWSFGVFRGVHCGARSRNRTGMALRPADFKSDASTSFAIRARG